MAAELVETSKLFARMVAKIDPTWVEPLAEHVVQRSYSEPHWSKKRGAVIAFEKVTLFGLPIVMKRAKVYSLIDPPICHELFIREALVEGNTKLNYSFLQENQALLEQADELLRVRLARRAVQRLEPQREHVRLVAREHALGRLERLLPVARRDEHLGLLDERGPELAVGAAAHVERLALGVARQPVVDHHLQLLHVDHAVPIRQCRHDLFL